MNVTIGIVSALAMIALATSRAETPTAGLKGPFAWKLSRPVVSPASRPSDPCCSVKDPTVVFFKGRWHVFCTIRSQVRTHQIEYLSFDKWENADKADRHLLTCRDNYFCAPQVFYFTPHKKWYLIYQVGEPDKKLKHHVGYSTTEDIADPNSWTRTQLIFADEDPRMEPGLDYWIICDAQRAYLFFTSLNGKMWRLWTKLEDFPRGFGHCEVALQADIFEASHTYRLAGLAPASPGQEKYLTVVEAGQSGKRYYKAYLADSLDGKWTPLADTQAAPFAGAANVQQDDPVWADNISHGELIRAGYDETMTVDPGRGQFLIQGVTEKLKSGKKYGEIPWRLGLLTPATGQAK